MLCAVDGDEDLHRMMRGAMMESCVIRGEVWIATLNYGSGLGDMGSELEGYGEL